MHYCSSSRTVVLWSIVGSFNPWRMKFDKYLKPMTIHIAIVISAIEFRFIVMTAEFVLLATCYPWISLMRVLLISDIMWALGHQPVDQSIFFNSIRLFIQSWQNWIVESPILIQKNRLFLNWTAQNILRCGCVQRFS